MIRSTCLWRTCTFNWLVG